MAPGPPPYEEYASPGGRSPSSAAKRIGVLDRIDKIVPPGVTVNVVDNMWDVGTMALGAGSRRR